MHSSVVKPFYVVHPRNNGACCICMVISKMVVKVIPSVTQQTIGEPSTTGHPFTSSYSFLAPTKIRGLFHGKLNYRKGKVIFFCSDDKGVGGRDVKKIQAHAFAAELGRGIWNCKGS